MKVHSRQILVVTLWTLTFAVVGLWHSRSVRSNWKKDSQANFSKKILQLTHQMQLLGNRCIEEPLQVRRNLESNFEVQVNWTREPAASISAKNTLATASTLPIVTDHPSGLRLFAEFQVEIQSSREPTEQQPTTSKPSKTLLRTTASQLVPHRQDQARQWIPFATLWLIGTLLATFEYSRQLMQMTTAQNVLMDLNNQLISRTDDEPRQPAFARTDPPNANPSTNFARQYRKNRQLDGARGLPEAIGQELMALDSRLLETLANFSNSEQHLQRLESILESMREGVVSVDRNLRLTAINPSAKELLDVRDAAIGSPLIETIRDPRISEIVTSTLEGGLPRSAEFSLRQHPDRHVRATTSLLASRNELGVLLVIRNITQIVRLEQMRRDFTANVSHELKTPLAAIKAYTETLLLGAIDDADNNRRFLEQINNQSERLEALVTDLLELARVQQTSSFRSQKLELHDLIESIVDSWRMIGQSNDVAVVTDLSAREIELTTDRESLSTILNNLISNAIRYTNDGGTVTVTSELFSPTGAQTNFVRITVRDTGIGIPKEDIERIFERFYRVEKARSVSLGGTGLGLSIVKNLVSVLGGKVKVSSEPNQGSEFVIELPTEQKTSPDLSKIG